MNATILARCPFLIPCGTKVKLKKPSTDKEWTVFFAGYKTYGRSTLYGTHDLFASFKALTKDGRMSTRYPEGWSSNTIATHELASYEIEILSFKGDYGAVNHPDCVDPEQYLKTCTDLAAVCITEMCTMAKNMGTSGTSFETLPATDIPWISFSDSEDGYRPVSSIFFTTGDDGFAVTDGNSLKEYSIRNAHQYDAHELSQIFKAFVAVCPR